MKRALSLIKSFLMRKNYFVNEESGFFAKQKKREATVKMPMTGSLSDSEHLTKNSHY